MSELLKINVNDKTEKKGQLTYLSWAWAWAEVLKIDSGATWEAHEYNGLPMIVLPDETCMVKVSVAINGNTKSCLLPVMDHKNKAIKAPDAFQINTAIMRCMTKAVSMHGLGLYIYAGEDLPEGEKPEPKVETKAISATEEAWKALDDDTQRYLRGVARRVTAEMPDGNLALEVINAEGMHNDLRAGLWYLLDSATRSALKRAQVEATA